MSERTEKYEIIDETIIPEKCRNCELFKAVKEFIRRCSMDTDELKIEEKGDILTIEGEMDVEFGVTEWNAELKMRGDIPIDYVEDLIKWTKIKSATKGTEKRPKWKITIERLRLNENV